MMGQHTRSESLFYYFRLEDHVPENHLLRLRGLPHVKEQFFLAATVQNVKRLVKFLNQNKAPQSDRCDITSFSTASETFCKLRITS
jgi:hypothetical protein